MSLDRLEIMLSLKQKIKKIPLLFEKLNHGDFKEQTSSELTFSKNSKTGIFTRDYRSYNDYVNHQKEKLEKVQDAVMKYDVQYECIVRERYKDLHFWKGSSVLCLAARLGGEVRAFKSLGALAIGIDLEPGDQNPYVLVGDFHDIQFADETFDYAFTNAIDHVLELDRFLLEVSRVLKKGGVFITEIAETKPNNYEVLDTRDTDTLIKIIQRYFEVASKNSIFNETSYANWNGKMLVLQKIA